MFWSRAASRWTLRQFCRQHGALEPVQHGTLEAPMVLYTTLDLEQGGQPAQHATQEPPQVQHVTLELGGQPVLHVTRKLRQV